MTQHDLLPIVVEDVHKRFEIPREKVSTLKERALHPFRRPATDTLNALRGVSFEVGPGEFFGIVGRNGSGKSTLLKCMAGIYAVDAGSIYVNGRMSTFIELGVGFNPDLPARDNALLNAAMLGLSPREARRRLDSVIDFAELWEFADLKLKNYSSGMLVRLAFSVMIHVDAEILLIDEVLAVGDAAFQQKCYDEFERIRSSGATVLLVTHDMSAVQRFCNRALLLEHGRPVELGEPEHVGNRYLELNFSKQAREAEEEAAVRADEGTEAIPCVDPSSVTTGVVEPNDAIETSELDVDVERYCDGSAEILEVWFEDDHGSVAEMLHAGRPCTFAARVRFNHEVDNPLFGIAIHNSRRDHVLSASNLWSDPRCGTFRPRDEVTFKVRFQNVLAPDRYHVTPAVARHGGGWIDRRERMASIVVTGTHSTDALLDLPYDIVIARAEHPSARAQLAR